MGRIVPISTKTNSTNNSSLNKNISENFNGIWWCLTLLSLPPFSFPHLCWRKRNWVLGELAHSSLLPCYFPLWLVVLRTLLWYWWAISGTLLPCSAVTFLLHTLKRRMCKSKAVQQKMGLETFLEHYQLSTLPSPGRRQAQHMLSTNFEGLFTFFSYSLFQSFYWCSLKFLSPWELLPSAVLLLSNSSNTRVQFSSISSGAWVLDWFVEDKWKEQLQMGFCAIRALNSLSSWLCVRLYLKGGRVGYEP